MKQRIIEPAFAQQRGPKIAVRFGELGLNLYFLFVMRNGLVQSPRLRQNRRNVVMQFGSVGLYLQSALPVANCVFHIALLRKSDGKITVTLNTIRLKAYCHFSFCYCLVDPALPE